SRESISADLKTMSPSSRSRETEGVSGSKRLNSNKEAQCPLCGGMETRLRNVILAKTIIALWKEFYRIDIRPELHNVSQLELRRCSSCSIIFFLPGSLAGSAAMYAQLEIAEANYYPQTKWEYTAALADLKGQKKVLEVGCGSGQFIALAKAEEGLS